MCVSMPHVRMYRIVESYISRNPRALFMPTIANSTHHRCLADHGYKPVDSCHFHQRFYHYHRHSRRHHLGKNKTTVQLSRRHWVGYVLNFAFPTKTGIDNWMKHCLTSGFELSAHSFPEAALHLASTKIRDLWPGQTPEVPDSPTSRHSAHIQSLTNDWLKIRNDYSAHASKIGPFQRSRLFGLSKKSVASGNEYALYFVDSALPSFILSWGVWKPLRSPSIVGDRVHLGTKSSLSSRLSVALNVLPCDWSRAWIAHWSLD